MADHFYWFVLPSSISWQIQVLMKEVMCEPPFPESQYWQCTALRGCYLSSETRSQASDFFLKTLLVSAKAEVDGHWLALATVFSVYLYSTCIFYQVGGYSFLTCLVIVIILNGRHVFYKLGAMHLKMMTKKKKKESLSYCATFACVFSAKETFLHMGQSIYCIYIIWRNLSRRKHLFLQYLHWLLV